MTSASPKPDPALEMAVMDGKLLKLANRGKSWNTRYFVLNGNILTYFHHQGDAEPKGLFVISNAESSCDIGPLYIDQRQRGTSKELLYCFRVTFDQDQKRSTGDDASTAAPPREPGTPASLQSPQASFRGYDTDEEVMDRTPAFRKLKIPRLTHHKRNTSEATTAVDDAVTPKFKYNQRNKLLIPHSPIRRKGSNDTGDNGLDIPSLSAPASQEPLSERGVALAFSNVAGSFDDDEDLQKSTSWRSYHQEQQHQEQQNMRSTFKASQEAKLKSKRKKIAEGTKWTVAAGAAVTVGVLTAGVGLVAGLVFIGAGAAAGGTGVVGGAAYNRMKKKGQVVIASANYEEARKWKSALDTCLVSETVGNSTWGQMFVMDGRNVATALLPTEITTVRTEPPSAEVSPREGGFFPFGEQKQKAVEPGTRWQPMEGIWAALLATGAQGLRVFREERTEAQKARLSATDTACPTLRSQIVLNASPLNSFLCLMSLARIAPNDALQPKSGQRASFQIIERIDDHTDVIHLMFRPTYLLPSWTTARDFCIFRYWRYESDGSYVICLESTSHAGCPPRPDYTRGKMHGVYTIAPPKKTGATQDDGGQTCLLTAVFQVDPRGWVPRGYCESFGVAALLQVLDIRDALDNERFVPIGTLDGFSRRALMDRAEDGDDPHSYDFSQSLREDPARRIATSSLSFNPPPLAQDKWAQPFSNSFRVRGKGYKKDGIKINAGLSIGRLVAVDIVNVDEPIYTGLSIHPQERMQLALEREKVLLQKGLKSDVPPFVFIVNIIFPGPPFYHGAYYYAIDDMSCIDGTDGTPSSKLCNEFFFGDSDEFRHKTFKLIPTIVEGNFVVRRAVGSTPAIMGTKLRQLYVKNARFFEVILDVGSSSVATGVVRLSLGYAKTLVVDMGFLFEGSDENTLPERIFGCVRMKYPEFGPMLRKVLPMSLEE